MVIWNCYERDQQGSNVSLEELSRSYISTGDDIEELGHLTELRVLDIAGYFRALALSEFLRKLQKLQNLSIHIQEIDDVNGWVGPQNLRSLQVDGCWFRKLPVWINHSHVQNLSFLRISVKQLQQEDMETLGRLHALHDQKWQLSCCFIRFLQVFFFQQPDNFGTYCKGM